jgi:hypothetical protein
MDGENEVWCTLNFGRYLDWHQDFIARYGYRVVVS